MEKIWKEVSQNEYQKCFDILNTQSLIEKETYKNFAIELFEIAKKQYQKARKAKVTKNKKK